VGIAVIDIGYPARGLAYIRRIAVAESYNGSKIILTAKSRDKIIAQQFEVVAVGNYEFCEVDADDECPRWHTKSGREHPHRLEIGDWILVKNRAWMLTPDPEVFVVKQDAILGVFETTGRMSA
jgi:hypothetical protein